MTVTPTPRSGRCSGRPARWRSSAPRRTRPGRPVVASLSDLREPIDMIEIFRNVEAAGPLVDEALALDPLPKVIWMQLGVRNDEAAARAEAKRVTVIMNRCPKIEYGRLSGEIGWTGVNSRIISSKRQIMRSGFQHRGLARGD